MKIYYTRIAFSLNIVLVCFSPLLATAQQTASNLSLFAARSPIEKVYLQTDREDYFAGETIWFKAYCYSEYFPDTISTTLYVELLSQASKVLTSKVLPVIYSASQGQVDLSDSLLEGTYFIRAYTATMLNHGKDFVFLKNIFVHGKKRSQNNLSAANNEKKITFFPESGNFIEGLRTCMAFKITDRWGRPLNLSGAIKNNNGELVDSFASYHDGMGRFFITPVPGEQYFAHLNDDAPGRKYELPGAAQSGVVLRIAPSTGKINYELYHHAGKSSMVPAYILGQAQHLTVFNIKVDEIMSKTAGVINTENLPPGIIHITVFNKEDIPLAERLCFVSNEDYVLSAELKADTLNNSPKGKNTFSFSLPEGTTGSFSLSVTDADFSGIDERRDNIISNLFLTSDLKGYIHQPAWYFSSKTPKDSARTALDILMMINGWRRFQWISLTQVVKSPLKYNDPGYISITGHVNIHDKKKPLAGKELMLWHFPQDSLKQPQMEFFNTDEAGKFKLDSLIFFGESRFLVSDISRKNEKWLNTYIDNDSIHSSLSLGPIGDCFLNPGYSNNTFSETTSHLDFFQTEDQRTLQEVKVTARQKTSLQLLDEKYTSPLFRSHAAKIIDLTNVKESEVSQINIFDYIQGRVAGITVKRKGTFDYELQYRQRMSLGDSGAAIPMKIYLDEGEVPISVIATIRARDIAILKVFPYFIGDPGNSPGGMLAIYTKKGEDLIPNIDKGHDVFRYKGYSVVKEFYSPDYSNPLALEQAKLRPDKRKTLLWLPQILTKGADTKMPFSFYNSDQTKNFKVVMEGVTNDGRLLMVEKIFPGNPLKLH